MPTAPPQELIIYSSDPDHVIAGYNPILMVCFKRAPQLEEIQLIEETVDAGLDAGIRGGVLYVVAREDFRAGVDPRLRAMLERIMRSASQRSGKNAVVILTQGFGGAVARGVLAGLLLMTDARTSVRVFKSAEEACTWLADCHDVPRAGLAQAWANASGALLSGLV